jgi:rubrerythrin|tara:strand:- start:26 stop:193 length:168 start_codon:yes stop_codon:yes gene_type:complete
MLTIIMFGRKKKKNEQQEKSVKRLKCGLCSAIFSDTSGDNLCPECYARGTIIEIE